LKPNISNETVFRIQRLTSHPISRGMDKAINDCLDMLDSFRTAEKKNQKGKLN